MLAGWAALTLIPGSSTVRYEGFLTGIDRQLVAVTDGAVPFPSTGLEIRTTGLWATHICETPLDHWTIGLEAFGLGVDDPAELYGRQFGDRVPIGFDLEWEAARPADPAGAGSGYRQACTVTGEILVGSEEIDLDAVGWRDHFWGTPPATPTWGVRGRLDDGTWLTVDGSADGVRASIEGEAEPAAAIDAVALLDGLPRAAAVEVGSRRIRLEPVAPTPLAVVGEHVARRLAPRALVRLVTDDSRSSFGWLAFDEPIDPLPGG